MAKKQTPKNADAGLFNVLSQLIEQSKRQLAIAANSTLTMLFWQVGERINGHILQNKRAAYGFPIVPTVSAQLEKSYGSNFTEKNIRRMMRFAEQFPEVEIVVTLSRQLTWSHFTALSRTILCRKLRKKDWVPNGSFLNLNFKINSSLQNN